MLAVPEGWVRGYQIEVVHCDDEAEFLRRFDAAWQQLRQQMFGHIIARSISSAVDAQESSVCPLECADQKST